MLSQTFVQFASEQNNSKTIVCGRCFIPCWFHDLADHTMDPRSFAMPGQSAMPMPQQFSAAYHGAPASLPQPAPAGTSQPLTSPGLQGPTGPSVPYGSGAPQLHGDSFVPGMPPWRANHWPNGTDPLDHADAIQDADAEATKEHTQYATTKGTSNERRKPSHRKPGERKE